MTNPNAEKPSLWIKLTRYSFVKNKRSTRNLERLCREFASDRRTLVVHSEDVDYKPYFPNAFAVTKRENKPADLHLDLYYTELAQIEAESYEIILCTGLLEHVPDPQRLIHDLHRILKPGGELILSASAVFSIHEGPNDFFHFTPFSLRHLFKNWSRFKMLRGSSQPFETIGILLQRILKQCRVFPLLRPLVELMFLTVPLLDRAVIAQYDTVDTMDNEHKIDSMLPSNIQAVVVK
jgi:SAM-dependent methyltransferase